MTYHFPDAYAGSNTKIRDTLNNLILRAPHSNHRRPAPLPLCLCAHVLPPCHVQQVASELADDRRPALLPNRGVRAARALAPSRVPTLTRHRGCHAGPSLSGTKYASMVRPRPPARGHTDDPLTPVRLLCCAVRLMQRVPYEGVSRMQTSLRRKREPSLAPNPPCPTHTDPAHRVRVALRRSRSRGPSWPGSYH